MPITIPNMSSTVPPNSENRWRNGYPKRVKVEHFLRILCSSSPRRVQRRQCHITCWGRSSCKKTTVPYLPIRLLHFRGGQKSAAPDRVNLGPRHISETITDRKLKFYAHLHRVKYTIRNMKIFPLGASQGAMPPCVNLGPLISWKLLEVES